MVEKQKTDIEVEYILNDQALVNDQQMAALPDYSIVINATGMGKDTPGSPVTDSALFPRHGIVWEFNYCGELDFLHQAQAPLERRDLQVEDGWMYFIQGWTMIVTRTLHIELTPALYWRLAALAETVHH